MAENGLRESKKARTRLAISDAATELFKQRGFEQVTVAEIAEAADVSIKTVFNYFATKEDLFFDRSDELQAGLIRTITERPPGTTIAGSLRGLLADNMVPFAGARWTGLRNPDGYERFRGFVATEHASPALRARRLVVSAAWAEQLAPVIAGELGIAADDYRAAVFAAMVLAAMAVREKTLSGGILAGVSARVIEKRVRAAVDEAFDRIDRAFADIDVSAPARAAGSPSS
ncbi:MAG: TetR/AcrR family transcriptional regulator [Solirubrobacteraceae bacterium]